VPGSFELPVVAKAMAKSGKFDAVVCIGVVVSNTCLGAEADSGLVMAGDLARHRVHHGQDTPSCDASAASLPGCLMQCVQVVSCPQHSHNPPHNNLINRPRSAAPQRTTTRL
jgi:hypothetical protein